MLPGQKSGGVATATAAFRFPYGNREPEKWQNRESLVEAWWEFGRDVGNQWEFSGSLEGV